MTTAAPGRRPPDPSQYWTVLNPDEQTADWRAFYADADERTATTRASLRCDLDIAYGTDERQMLDVYAPRSAADGEVLVFIHGGGFREGDRAHYGYVAQSFATRGVVTVVPGYRLMPDATFFDAVEDIRSALAWVAAQLARKVRIAGHSAGGILAGFLGAETTWLAERSLPPDFVHGFAGISAGYDFTSEALPSFARGRFSGDDERRRASPVFNVRDPAPHALVAIGEHETTYAEPAKAFAQRLTEAGVAADYFVAPGMGHDATVLDVGSAQTEMFRRIFAALWAD